VRLRATPIYIISDQHYGRGKGTAPLAPLLELIRRHPGPIVLPGDLTGDGHAHEYDEAQRVVEALAATGSPIAMIPGNHDIRSSKWPSRWEQLARHVHGHPSVLARGPTRSIVRAGDDVFVCLRSAHRSSRPSYGIRTEALQWAATQLRAHRVEGARLHLVTHASLWPLHGHHRGRGWDKEEMRQRRRVERELLLPFGFYSVIHGHAHVYAYAPDRPLPHSGHPIVHVGAPTLYGGRGQPNRSWLEWEPGSEPVVHSA
jgi:predicted phosphodiesterase